MSDDPRLRGIPASASDKDRANERDRLLADLTARLRADNQRFAERVTAPSVDNESSSSDDDQAQKRRSRFWELIHMLTSRDRRDTESTAPNGALPNDLVDDYSRVDGSSVVERAALEAIAEALATPDLSRDLAALQSLAAPHPYEPTKRAQRPLPLIEERPAFAAPLKADDGPNEGNDIYWQEVKAEALRLLEVQLLDAPAAHLAYIQERIKPVLDHGTMES